MGPGRRRRPRVAVAGAVLRSVLVPVVAGALVLAGCGGSGADAAARCRSGVGRDVRERVAGRAVAVHLPPCYDLRPAERYPVVYLLHGSGADESMWPDLGSGEVADRLVREGRTGATVLVQPDLGDADGTAAATALVDRVVPWADRHLRTRADATHRVVGGISLGASAALRAAATRPGTFAAVAAVSPVVGGPTGAIVEGLGAQRLPVLVVVGRDDRQRGQAVALARGLRAAGASVRFHEPEGGHDRDLWRGQVERVLAFYGTLWP